MICFIFVELIGRNSDSSVSAEIIEKATAGKLIRLILLILYI